MAKAKEENDFEVDIRDEKPGLYKDDEYEITLPLTKEKQDDVTVQINGFITKIQRGVPVKVSAAVYEVLKNSENMDALAIRRSNDLEAKAREMK
jgi:hypothetical protein